MSRPGGTAVVIGGALAALALIGAVPLLVGLLFTVVLSGGGDGSCRAVATEGRDRGVPNGWGPLVEDAAKVSGLPPGVLAAQLEAESGWDPRAVSPAGAAGLAQFMPGTWDQYGAGDPLDPASSIKAQGQYMRALMGLAGEHSDTGDEQLRMALAAYNWGPGNMDAVGWDWTQGPPETTNYVASILDTAQVGFSDGCAPVVGQYAGDLGDGEWATPLPGGSLISGFGYRNVPGLPAWAQNHVGIDLASATATFGPSGTVVAPFPMRVTSIYAPDGCVLARQTDPPGFGIALCHMDSWNARVGTEYGRGDVVGVEGNRGLSVGVLTVSHLHLELYRPEGGDPTTPGPSNRHAIDPTPILRAKGAL